MKVWDGWRVRDVFFSCLSLQQLHKHKKLCVSIIILCKHEYELHLCLQFLCIPSFLPSTIMTHALQIKSYRLCYLTILELGASGFCPQRCQKGKQAVCCQNTGHHLSLIAHESRGNGSVIAP
ncbi:hypothetical protein AMECASPLE_012063 [Ameca splendens]|uniref:Uncharacterized protein n=1 Tax=Ameca splendens TaxID=208324 RepID=A0ABV0YCD8_9TELE